jgi:pilus assembly protein FimV
MAAHQETVDPVVEADTFLAFGRDAQAEEILLEALKTEPQRQAIHMKLLTIYAARKSVSRFESVAKELHALTGGEGTDWEKAAAMGAAIDPENSLYASAGLAEAPADVDMTSTTILRSPTAVLDQPPEVAAETGATTESAGLDFDLDIGTSAGGGDAATAAASVSSPEVAGLDFDLDLGAPADTPSADSTPQPSAASADVVLDIDFDMPAKESAAPALEVPAVVAVDPGGIDFDFDMGTSDSAAPAPLPEMSIETPSVASEPAPLDLGGISLELDTPAVSTASAGPGVADSADNPEVVTKLELAAAYAEMGDKDGARELYQEALAEGSPAQQKVARAKLDSLG